MILQSFPQNICWQQKSKSSVDLSLSVLKISKIVIYEFWYDYVKPKHGEKATLCYMNTDSL